MSAAKVRKPLGRISARPTTPAKNLFSSKTEEPIRGRKDEPGDLASISEVRLRENMTDTTYERIDIDDLRGKLRLRRSMPPKF